MCDENLVIVLWNQSARSDKINYKANRERLKKAVYINATELLKKKPATAVLFKNLFNKAEQEEAGKKTWHFVVLLSVCCYCLKTFTKSNTWSVYCCVNFFK